MPLTVAKDEENKEKEKEGYGRGLGHVLYPGTWVEAGGHDHAEGGSSEQAVVLPSETPAIGGALLVEWVLGFRAGSRWRRNQCA